MRTGRFAGLLLLGAAIATGPVMAGPPPEPAPVPIVPGKLPEAPPLPQPQPDVPPAPEQPEAPQVAPAPAPDPEPPVAASPAPVMPASGMLPMPVLIPRLDPEDNLVLNPNARGEGLSFDGTIMVGGTSSSAGYRAYIWSEETGMQPLPIDGLAATGTAYAVSGDGRVVAGRHTASGLNHLGNYEPWPFVWSRDTGALVDIGLETGTVWAVNGDGSVMTGTTLFPETMRMTRAFVWRAETGAIDLGEIESTSCEPLPAAISADGSRIVGGCSNRAFLWTAGGGMIELPGLDNPHEAHAADITADGSVIVGGSGDVSVRWIGDSVQELTGFDGWVRHYANGVSDDGAWVIGAGSQEESYMSAPVGFLWHEALGVIEIPVPEGYGYVIPQAISADGSVIIGTAHPTLFNRAHVEETPFRWEPGF